jgi:hypothetical protein
MLECTVRIALHTQSWKGKEFSGLFERCIQWLPFSSSLWRFNRLLSVLVLAFFYIFNKLGICTISWSFLSMASTFSAFSRARFKLGADSIAEEIQAVLAKILISPPAPHRSVNRRQSKSNKNANVGRACRLERNCRTEKVSKHVLSSPGRGRVVQTFWTQNTGGRFDDRRLWTVCNI